ISIICFIISPSLGIPDEAAPVPEVVLVPGGIAGLGAVLGELVSDCANAADAVMITVIPTKILANRVGLSFIGGDLLLNRDPRSSLMLPEGGHACEQGAWRLGFGASD